MKFNYICQNNSSLSRTTIFFLNLMTIKHLNFAL